MNPLLKPVKEEHGDYPDISSSGSSSSDVHSEPPRPIEGLHDTGPPPFLTKTYDVVEDKNTDQIVSWSQTGNSFVVWDPQTFSKILLPKYFKHNNFSSFVRQLNTYGFRKVDPDRWEFANEGFLRGKKHLLKTIKRRRPAAHPPVQQSVNRYLEVGEFGLEGEVDRLKRDKQLLMAELVKLKLDQQKSRALLRAVEERLHLTEQKQELTMTFIARVMRNPNFLQRLVEQKEKMKELEDAISRKRRRPIDRAPENDHAGTSASQEFRVPVKMEVQGTEDFRSDGFSSLESLTGMQGFINKGENDEEHMEQENSGGELNDEFWEELLHEGIGDDNGGLDIEGANSDVDVLASRLHFLGSASPE